MDTAKNGLAAGQPSVVLEAGNQLTATVALTISVDERSAQALGLDRLYWIQAERPKSKLLHLVEGKSDFFVMNRLDLERKYPRKLATACLLEKAISARQGEGRVWCGWRRDL